MKSLVKESLTAHSLQNLHDDFIAAKKAGDKQLADTLGFLYSEMQNERIKLRRDLVEADMIGVAKKCAKHTSETLEFAINGGKKDTIEKCTKELEILNSYIPKSLSKEELTAEVKKLVTVGMNKGQAMKAVMGTLKGKADGKLISTVVDEVLKG